MWYKHDNNCIYRVDELHKTVLSSSCIHVHNYVWYIHSLAAKISMVCKSQKSWLLFYSG